MDNTLTNAEFAILGLLVERPCHGYDLERLIEERGMREWTELAFSSIYYLLKKLENRKLIEIQQAGNDAASKSRKSRKTYAPTPEGYALHGENTRRMIAEPGPSYPSILLGMANWPTLKSDQALNALRQRRDILKATLKRVSKKQGPAPAFVDVLFDYSISQIKSEIRWINRALITLGEER